jgi:hypothetical protein
MRKRNPKDPRWKLDSQWGVDTNDYNWILYFRRKKIDGSPGKWKATGYYPTAAMLLENLYQKLSMTEPNNLALLTHLEYLCKRVEGLAERLYTQLNAEVWSGLHRPAAGLGRKTA